MCRSAQRDDEEPKGTVCQLSTYCPFTACCMEIGQGPFNVFPPPLGTALGFVSRGPGETEAGLSFPCPARCRAGSCVMSASPAPGSSQCGWPLQRPGAPEPRPAAPSGQQLPLPPSRWLCRPLPPARYYLPTAASSSPLKGAFPAGSAGAAPQPRPLPGGLDLSPGSWQVGSGGVFLGCPQGTGYPLYLPPRCLNFPSLLTI